MENKANIKYFQVLILALFLVETCLILGYFLIPQYDYFSISLIDVALLGSSLFILAFAVPQLLSRLSGGSWSKNGHADFPPLSYFYLAYLVIGIIGCVSAEYFLSENSCEYAISGFFSLLWITSCLVFILLFIPYLLSYYSLKGRIYILLEKRIYLGKKCNNLAEMEESKFRRNIDDLIAIIELAELQGKPTSYEYGVKKLREIAFELISKGGGNYQIDYTIEKLATLAIGSNKREYIEVVTKVLAKLGDDISKYRSVPEDITNIPVTVSGLRDVVYWLAEISMSCIRNDLFTSYEKSLMYLRIISLTILDDKTYTEKKIPPIEYYVFPGYLHEIAKVAINRGYWDTADAAMRFLGGLAVEGLYAKPVIIDFASFGSPVFTKIAERANRAYETDIIYTIRNHMKSILRTAEEKKIERIVVIYRRSIGELEDIFAKLP